MKQIITLCVILSLTLSACLKNNEVFIPHDEETLTSLISKTKRINQSSAVINSEKENLIIAAENDLIIIPENAFVDEQGNKISGEVLVEYDIAKSTRKIIQSNRENLYNGNLLKSFFTIELQAKKGDKKLKLTDGATITYYVNYKSTDDGNQPKPFEYLNNGWNLVETKAQLKIDNWNIKFNSGMIFGSGYIVKTSAIGEIQFAKESTNTVQMVNVCLNLPVNFNNRNTVSYAIIKDQKLVIKLEHDDDFCTPRIPNGNITKVVSMTQIGDNISIFEDELNINRDLRISGIPRKINFENLQTWILGL